MADIKQRLDLVNAVFFLTIGNVVAGKNQVIDDRAGISPGFKQIVIFKEGIMPIASVSHHQRLHRDAVFLHQIRDAGVGIDNNFVSQPHLSTFIVLLGGNEFFAERPVMITNRHTNAGVGIHHLFSGDDLYLIRVGSISALIFELEKLIA